MPTTDPTSDHVSGQGPGPWLRLALPSALLSAAYLFAVRPWHRRWGARDEEVSRAMPGDEVVAWPDLETTRAITIQAPPAAVWPWLVQIGYGRAGWYSYDRLEGAVGAGEFLEGHSARRIIPELQNLEVGDLVPVAAGMEWFRVEAVEPPRALVLSATMNPITGLPVDLAASGPSLKGTWTFVLSPLGERATRLTARFRASYRPHLRLAPAMHLVLEPAHFIMERKMLLGIRDRAERAVGTADLVLPVPYPTGLLRPLFRTPVPLYQLGLGRLLRWGDSGFLLLTTTGRKTGRPRLSPLQFRSRDGTYYVIAAWGSRSDWYRNLLANPRVHVQAGSETFDALAEPIEDRAVKIEVLKLFYGGTNSAAIRRLMGLSSQPTDEQIWAAMDTVRLVALRPLPGTTL